MNKTEYQAFMAKYHPGMNANNNYDGMTSVIRGLLTPEGCVLRSFCLENTTCLPTFVDWVDLKTSGDPLLGEELNRLCNFNRIMLGYIDELMAHGCPGNQDLTLWLKHLARAITLYGEGLDRADNIKEELNERLVVSRGESDCDEDWMKELSPPSLEVCPVADCKLRDLCLPCYAEPCTKRFSR